MDKKLAIYYDGECVVCDAEISLYRKLDRNKDLGFIDISHPGFDASKKGLDPIEVNKIFHIELATGDFVTGVDAFIEIWRYIPSLKWAAFIGKFPPIKVILKLGYKVFVVIRPYLPRKKRCDSGRCEL